MSSTHNYCRLYIAPSIDIGFSISKECGQIRKHKKIMGWMCLGWLSGVFHVFYLVLLFGSFSLEDSIPIIVVDRLSSQRGNPRFAKVGPKS